MDFPSRIECHLFPAGLKSPESERRIIPWWGGPNRDILPSAKQDSPDPIICPQDILSICQGGYYPPAQDDWRWHPLEGVVLWEAAWSATPIIRSPCCFVELGAGHGGATRVIAYTANELDAELTTCDPSNGSNPERFKGVPCRYLPIGGETLFEQTKGKVDFLFVDTRHGYYETLHWLNTWVEQKLSPGGIAAFHDAGHLSGSSPTQCGQGTEVGLAIEHWIMDGHGNWYWFVFPFVTGIGLLSREPFGDWVWQLSQYGVRWTG